MKYPKAFPGTKGYRAIEKAQTRREGAKRVRILLSLRAFLFLEVVRLVRAVS
jgi:hypothetical protein